METFKPFQPIQSEDNHLFTYLNKKHKLPANQLINDQYSPDIKPIIKFITIDLLNKKQNNINYIPPKVKNEDFQAYGSQFHIFDTLGYHYANYFDQMIYFKFNNSNHNELNSNRIPKTQVKTQSNSINSQLISNLKSLSAANSLQTQNKNANRTVKYFSGLFIPLETLSTKKFKEHQNIYEAIEISTPEIKQSFANSFAKNSKGCSLDPLFSSNYIGGNLMAAIRKKPYEYDLIIQNEINSKAAECFNFAVKFIEEGTYKFNIVNLSSQISAYKNGMKIQYFSFFKQSFKEETSEAIKSGDGWGFGGQNISFNKTVLRKENQSIQQCYYCLSFDYKCKSRQQIVNFANSIPYSTLDYERFLSRIQLNKNNPYIKMEKVQIGSTLSGIKIFSYLFHHRKSRTNTLFLKNIVSEKLQNIRLNQRHKTINLNSSINALSSGTLMPINSPYLLENSNNVNLTKTIVFFARQHSGQTVSSFFIEGLIEFVMESNQFDGYKKNVNFIVIPFVNPDGMKYGNQKTNLAGVDLDKIWRNPNQIFQPQIFNVKKFLRKVHQNNPIIMIIELSSNFQTLNSHFKSIAPKNESCDNVQIFPFMCSKRIPQISFQNSQFLPNQHNNNCLNVLSDMFPKALVYNFSSSSYGWKYQHNFRKQNQSINNEEITYEFTPQIYRNIGKQLITTYFDYLRLCEKNIGTSQINQITIQQTKYQEKHRNFPESKQ